MSELNPQPIPPGRRSVELSAAIEAIVDGVLRATEARKGAGAAQLAFPGRIIAGGILEPNALREQVGEG
jgi:hypothetical protein